MILGELKVPLSTLSEECRKTGTNCPAGVDGIEAMKADAAQSQATYDPKTLYIAPEIQKYFPGYVAPKAGLPPWVLPAAIGGLALIVVGFLVWPSRRAAAPAVAGYWRRKRRR